MFTQIISNRPTERLFNKILDRAQSIWQAMPE
jgi:hypothetical protein